MGWEVPRQARLIPDQQSMIGSFTSPDEGGEFSPWDGVMVRAEFRLHSPQRPVTTAGDEINTDVGAMQTELPQNRGGCLSDRPRLPEIEFRGEAQVGVDEVLERVAGLEISTWNYKAQNESVRHMGPMAQDFHAAFGLGNDDTRITTVDADGVSLAAIQALNHKLNQALEKKDAQIADLEKRIAQLESLVLRVSQAK